MTPTEDRHLVDASPARRFFVSMLVRDIELIPAIIDLVDNSADGAKRLRPEPADDRYDGLFVHVFASPDEFVIHDNCGGMDVNLAREKAFRFGRATDSPEPIGEVGQFGIGMKRALFKLGDHFTVESATATSRFTLPVEVPEWTTEEDGDWSFRFSALEEGIEVGEGDRGTKIVVKELHDLVRSDFAQDRFLGRLRHDLAQRELRLLQQGLEIKVNGKSLSAQPPVLLAGEDFGPINIEKVLEVDDSNTLRMRLWAGLADPEMDEDADDLDEAEKYRKEPPAGWYVFCNDRLLLFANKDRLTGWASEAAAYHPQYSRFRGYLMLEGDARYMPWNTTKTGVDEDSRVFREIQVEMIDALQKVQAVINRLKKERRQPEAIARPALVALEHARPVSLEDVAPSPTFQVPAPAPVPPSTAKWIRYQVDLDDFEAVAKSVGSETPSDVGRTTFDWYLQYQVD